MSWVRIISKNICTIISMVLTGLFLFGEVAHAQPAKIMGTVTDKDTSEPLAAVNVYISQTTIGATTNKDGFFKFSTTISGKHELVFSFVGFESQVKTIHLTGSDKKLVFEVELKPKTTELEEIEVSSKSEDWQRQLDKFKTHFLGFTSSSLETEIVNSWILNFETDDFGNLTATAPSALFLVNYSLGYRMHINLGKFVLRSGDEVAIYETQVRFEEMTPKDENQANVWKENRKMVYLGSFRHFLKSLYYNRLKQEKFDVVQPNSSNMLSIQKLNPEEDEILIYRRGMKRVSTDKPMKGFRLPGAVDVLYGREQVTLNYTNAAYKSRSRLTPLTSDKKFLVTEDGRLWDYGSVKIDGAWGFQRLATLLPYDYSPEQDQRISN